MDYDSPGSLVAAALQAKPTTRLGGSDGGAIGESNLVQTYLERIDTSAKDLKGEIYDLIKEKYDEFLPLFHDTSEMSSKVQRLASDMERLADGIEASAKPALHSASQQQTKLKGRLDECDGQITLLSELLAIHEEFEGAQKDKYCANYLSAAKRLKQADEFLDKALAQGCEAQIYISLQDELIRQRAQLITTLSDVWSLAFKFSFTNSRTTRLSSSSSSSPLAKLELNSRLAVDGGHDINFLVMVQSLELTGALKKYTQELGQRLLKHLLLPCVTDRCVKASVTTSSRTITLSLVEAENTQSDPQARAGEVFYNLQALLDAIHGYISTRDKGIAARLCSQIGSVIWQELCDAIINKSLAQAVPSQSTQMALYESVVKATQEFEESMAGHGFVPEGCLTLLSKYAGNVNVHFASKKCEELLVKARSLITGDLHNTVLITPRSDAVTMTRADATSSSSTNMSFDEKRSEAEISLAEGVLYMPRCRISVFMQELVQLARDTLQEATNSGIDCAIQLFFSVRNIFELYSLVTPTFHRRSVAEVPLLAALQHNNSFYLSHQLLMLGHQFRSLHAKSLLSDTASFVDLVPAIRKVGEECLVSQLRKQHDDLLVSLEGAKQFTAANDTSQQANIDKALRQVVHQLTRLANLWRDVLPKDVFLRSIALLMDAVVNSAVSSVVSLEDISATEATALHTHLLYFQTELPPLLSTLVTTTTGEGKAVAGPPELAPVTNDDLCRLVTRWKKFTYLLTLLDAKMQTVVDLWNHGKGPLVGIYTAAEVRRLLRALFQNTDRRSNALATIKAPGS